MQKYSDIY